jgi:hypothetical protein
MYHRAAVLAIQRIALGWEWSLSNSLSRDVSFVLEQNLSCDCAPFERVLTLTIPILAASLTPFEKGFRWRTKERHHLRKVLLIINGAVPLGRE